MAIIPIYSVTKIAIIDKVEKKILEVAGISSVEETHISQDKEYFLVVTSKAYKIQVKIEADHILRGITLYIISPAYNNQLDTITREHRHSTQVSYDVALQRETEHGSKIKI